MFNIAMFKMMGDILIKEAFPRTAPSRIEKYKSYGITIAPHEYKSRAGCYNAHTRKIELSGTETACRKDVIITFIHELSHHIETVDTGASGHQASFYKIHTTLLKKAIDLEIISPEEIQDTETNNHTNRRKLAKMMVGYKKQGNKKLSDFMDTSFLYQLLEEPKIQITYKVRVPIEEKDLFKAQHYHWLAGDKVWYKIVNTVAEKTKENTFLEENGYRAIDIDGIMYYTKYIIATIFGDTYFVKDMLTELGYKYDGSQWSKVVNVKDIKANKNEISAIKATLVAKINASKASGETPKQAKKTVGVRFSFGT